MFLWQPEPSLKFGPNKFVQMSVGDIFWFWLRLEYLLWLEYIFDALCFRSDYSNATDLHIAVTTSGGDIVEFDRFGLRRHRRDDNPPEWRQSLMVGDVPEPWHDFWDEVLQQVSAESETKGCLDL